MTPTFILTVMSASQSNTSFGDQRNCKYVLPVRRCREGSQDLDRLLLLESSILLYNLYGATWEASGDGIIPWCARDLFLIHRLNKLRIKIHAR